MKLNKLGIFLFSLAFVFLIAASANAVLISFLEEDGFSGVDNTTGFSTDDSAVVLNTARQLLGGFGVVSAWNNEGRLNLTHRGTRGLGVQGGEFDEVDTLEGRERIVIGFDEQVYLNSVTVRSLFCLILRSHFNNPTLYPKNNYRQPA